jgi:hypothetical protein
MWISFVFVGMDIQPNFGRGGTLRKDVTPESGLAVAAARHQEITTG